MMDYIYDILLNFSDVLYEFYEWDNKDDVRHFKKIPVVKVKSEFLEDLFFGKIKVNNIFLESIYKKAEDYNSNNILYLCIFTDGFKAIGVNFNHDGFVINKSNLLLEEENEVLNLAFKLNLTDIIYKNLYKKIYFVNNSTRNELNIKYKLLSDIKNAFFLKDYSKIRYLYYEAFNIKNRGIKDMYNKLITDINNNMSNKYIELYKLLLLETRK